LFWKITSVGSAGSQPTIVNTTAKANNNATIFFNFLSSFLFFKKIENIYIQSS
jgi:hypothetical protein